MSIIDFVFSQRGLDLLRAVVIAVVGLLVARVGAGLGSRLAGRYFETQQVDLLRKAVFYGVVVLTAMSVLHQLGFSLTIILGAAGVLSVAIGFASQTSASNLISGLFLIGEKPFGVGDVIRVGETVGEVLSIDLLSVKLRTFDNLFVRVPNETLIKSQIVNLTRFDIRRLELKVSAAYKEDLAHVRRVLLEVAEAYPLCLTEPKPAVLFLGFGDSGLELQFNIWSARENFLELRNTMPERVKRAFDAEGIEIPFPHRSLYAGEATAPFPIRIVDDAGGGGSASDMARDGPSTSAPGTDADGDATRDGDALR